MSICLTHYTSWKYQVRIQKCLGGRWSSRGFLQWGNSAWLQDHFASDFNSAFPQPQRRLVS